MRSRDVRIHLGIGSHVLKEPFCLRAQSLILKCYPTPETPNAEGVDYS